LGEPRRGAPLPAGPYDGKAKQALPGAPTGSGTEVLRGQATRVLTECTFPATGGGRGVCYRSVAASFNRL
jgi:hypothetical protein